jgi:hypothetical protein
VTGTTDDIDFDSEMALAATFGQMVSGSLTLRQFADDENLLKRLARFEPLAAARTFANLLLQPRLQGNNFRAEVLAQLALTCAKGKAKVDPSALRQIYNAMDQGWAGRLEDPPEDVFVSQVRCRAGNFRLIEGMWEGNGFYLQLFLDLVEGIPRGVNGDRIRASVLAMLRLSDTLCDRAGLARWTMGAMNALDIIDTKRAASLLVGRNKLRFTLNDLAESEVDLTALEPFLFELASAVDLLDRPPAGSPVESRPLVFDGTALHVVLPTAFSAAIRAFVINTLRDSGNAKALKAGIANVYMKHWFETPLPGVRSHNAIQFEEESGTYWGELTVEIDRGRHLHLLFIVDPLDDFDQGGLSGGWNTVAQREVFDRRILAAWQAEQGDDYRAGLSLVISCGVGRATAIAFGEREMPGWRVEFASAYDLDTLSWLPNFDVLTLWRLLDQRDEAARLGLEMMNVNGLINLVAWSRQLDGHIVPHGDLEDGQVGALLGIDQTALREVRREVATATDPQVARDVNGRLLRIRRDYDDSFAEDTETAIYGSEDPGPSGKPMAVVPTSRRVWWADTVVPDEVSGEIGYERWKTVRLWLSRMASVLDTEVTLPDGPLHWIAMFDVPSSDGPLTADRLGFAAARAEITVSTDGPVIITKASKHFELAWLNEENVAERALVAAFIDGIAQLAGGMSAQRSTELLNQIVAHPLAKQQHGFVARGFRDWMRDTLRRKPVMITREDDAATRLGLGWTVRDRSQGAWIEGQEDCNAFLAALVRHTEDNLCATLGQFERVAFVEALLLNHERAAFDRDLWDRTAASNLALRSDRVAALETMRMHKFRLNATSVASRLLIELAVCVCPVGHGRLSGVLDLSNLLARMMLIFEVGGWSDAIRWGVMTPKLRVTPLGDVHGNFDWHDEIVAPFGEKTGNDKISDAEKDYAENLEELPVKPTVDLDPALDAAWTEQFGASFQQARVFIEHLEDEGRRRREAVIKLSRDELRRFTVAGEVVDGIDAEHLVDALLLSPRDEWRVPPVGFQPKDIFPWRFRRPLSLLRRPLVQVDTDTILIAPGLLREAFAYMLGNYWSGDFPREQLSPKMSAWQDKVVGERGRKLAEKVAAKLQADGWTVWIEKKMSELLNKRLDRDYGDVDVLARKGDRVLAIECKDLMYRKTHGEITEQVRDYRGEERNGKRDELRKHLDRMDVLRVNLAALAKYVGLPTLVTVESHLVFRNPVPAIYALQRTTHDVKVHILSEIGSI